MPNVISEYAAIRNHAALIQKPWCSQIMVKGEDRVNFLHRMLSQDIESLKPGEGTYAAFLSAAGKVLAMMAVYVLQNHILLITKDHEAQKLIGLLDEFLITEDVRLEDVTEKFSLLALRGPKAGLCVESFGHASLKFLPPFGNREIKFGENQLMAIRYVMRGQSGFDFLIEKKAAAKMIRSLLDFGKSYGLIFIGSEAWEIFRIETGILRYGIDVDDQIALPETGLEDLSSSETKGCYPGQEVVARMKTYGGHTKKMTGLIFEKGPVPFGKDKVYNEDKEIGWITSAVFSPTLQKGIALAYLQKGFFDREIPVTIQSSQGTLKAKITRLPFIPLTLSS
ncbi:MAG: aminomethyl transferase family protein [Candidatus Omnitrophica bacterium]|nr:aminomethyl transferase family protein [Candidatus Omnitrophota bacterium]